MINKLKKKKKFKPHAQGKKELNALEFQEICKEQVK